MKKIYLDNSATTPLSPQVKQYIIEHLDKFYNPSSLYQGGLSTKQIIEESRNNIARFLHGNSDKIIFCSSGSAANSLVIKGLTNEDPLKNEYKVFCSPTAHKSMNKACESCLLHSQLRVSKYGEIDMQYLENILYTNQKLKSFVCIEYANSEIGTINNVSDICELVHRYNGIILIDATGYIPTNKVDMCNLDCDFLTFSGHKLHALKGVGVLYKKNNIDLKPLVYGSQEQGLFAGTQNVIGITSLGKAVENYDYSSISSENRDYIYNYIIKNIPESYLIGAPLEHRTPHNLYMCFKDVGGESLMTLLDMNGIQVSTGSACNSGDLQPSSTLIAIGVSDDDLHSCIRLSFSGNETKDELDYVCQTIKKCVEQLRNFN